THQLGRAVEGLVGGDPLGAAVHDISGGGHEVPPGAGRPARRGSAPRVPTPFIVAGRSPARTRRHRPRRVPCGGTGSAPPGRAARVVGPYEDVGGTRRVGVLRVALEGR